MKECKDNGGFAASLISSRTYGLPPPCCAMVGVSSASWCIMTSISLLIISSARCRSVRGGSLLSGRSTAWLHSRGRGKSRLTVMLRFAMAASRAKRAISAARWSTSLWSSMNVLASSWYMKFYKSKKLYFQMKKLFFFFFKLACNIYNLQYIF